MSQLIVAGSALAGVIIGAAAAHATLALLRRRTLTFRPELYQRVRFSAVAPAGVGDEDYLLVSIETQSEASGRRVTLHFENEDAWLARHDEIFSAGIWTRA